MGRPLLRICCLVLLALYGTSTAASSEGIRAGMPIMKHKRSLQALSEMFQLPSAVQGGAVLGAYDSQALIPIVVSLKARASPDEFLDSLEDPSSPNYQQYITPKGFASKFGASQASLGIVSDFLSSSGMTDISVSAGGLIVTATATVKQAEDAFKTSIFSYQSASGDLFYSASTLPSIPESLQGIVLSIEGLDNYPYYSSSSVVFNGPDGSGRASGPSGGLTPADIAKVYNIPTANYTGAGQVYAIATLASYTVKDPTKYASYFGLGSLNLTNIYVGDVSKAFNPGSAETDLDIAMQSAVSPRASILVYQARNTKAGFKELLRKIADDNKASVISFSWGTRELDIPFYLVALHQVFQQMAAQGQSFFVASGDNGCYGGYDNTKDVGSPDNDPSVCAVGGTTFAGNSTYSQTNQKAWRGSGGGISRVFKAAKFQSAVTNSTMRMVPDVALNSDPQTGYTLFYTNRTGVQKHFIYGGTSAAAPLWASFTGLVNECRARMGKGRVGPLPPKLYPLALNTTLYNALMDDVTFGDNICYKAKKGYDLATGLGTFNGLPLLNYLCSL